MKQLIKTYSYSKSAKTVTLTDFTTVKLERLYLIIDSTLNVLMYNMVDPTVSPATVATNVITLTNVPASSANGDSLQIIYDCETGDPTYDTPPLALNAALETGGNLATIAGKDFATQTTLAAIKAKTDNIDVALSTRTKPTDTQKVDGSGVTQPVSLATAPTTPVTGTFYQATQPVSGTVTTTPPSNASTNLTQVGGVSVSLGQTTRSGSIPVTLPSDGAGVPFGTWGYNAGISGTLTLTGGKRVLMISAIAEQAAATITINGGDTITLPYGSTDKVSSALEIRPAGNLTNPTIVFTSTVAYFVEYVS